MFVITQIGLYCPFSKVVSNAQTYSIAHFLASAAGQMHNSARKKRDMHMPNSDPPRHRSLI